MGFWIFFFSLGFVFCFFEKEFQAGLKLTTRLKMSLNFDPPDSTSPVLRLYLCAIVLGLWNRNFVHGKQAL